MQFKDRNDVAVLGICMQMDKIENNLYTTVKYIIEKNEFKNQIKYAQKQQRNAGGIIRAADLVEEYYQTTNNQSNNE